MSFIDEVRAKRQGLADVMSDADYSGIRDIVEELYPDRAHFIYELLQNAEDRGATEVMFSLDERSVGFEHNGETFNEEDVLSITNIGKSAKTKKEQADQIGRFGIGFKAVFAYSETPHIWSPTFSFKISQLVLPSEIPARSDLDGNTRFQFPFNNPKKRPQDAYAEVKAGLEELAETALLFLSNLQKIVWRIEQGRISRVVRIQHTESHIEIQKQASGKTIAGAHFLRFSKPVEGLEKQSVAIAFALDYLSNVLAFDPRQPLAKQLKIVPANPGCVAVFFPADKETSGLRFHLHAPFVPELSRASIKDTPANEPLFTQLAKLAADSLGRIRDLQLLTGDFLGVLPNPQDSIAFRYQSIRSAIVKKMNEEPLTPTYSKGHAPAKLLLQAKASLKECFSRTDIHSLLGSSEGQLQWAIGVTQKNSNADRFLSSLGVRTWDVEKLIEQLRTMSYIADGPKSQLERWLATHPSGWHQQLYALLHREVVGETAIRRLRPLKLVRVSDGSYSVGDKCYFPSNGIENDKMFPRVEVNCFLSGTSNTDRQDSRALLSAIGVREVGEPEQVLAILKQGYSVGRLHPDLRDVTRFIELVELDKSYAKQFSEYAVVNCADGKWRKPSQCYVDSPVSETGLTAFFQSFGNSEKFPVSPSYADLGQPPEKVRRFLDGIGVQTKLEVTQTTCPGNPEWRYLHSVPGERMTSPIDTDFVIRSLDKALLKPTLALSRLVWRTMRDLPSQYLKACYQKNTASGKHEAASQLVHLLRKLPWVPQGDGKFVPPAEAERSLLPDGFPFDAGAEWIKRVQFGESSYQRVERNKKLEVDARNMGFADVAALERARHFAAFPQAEQERILAQFQSRLELPEHEPRNPSRRADQVGKHAATAPERKTEYRSRSVSVGREEVKEAAAEYLRQQYTKPDGEMICQICKGPLPFKLEDGNYYCEKVEFLEDLQRRHHQNYLSLCPNHGAMFREANGSRAVLKGTFTDMHGQELNVVLARADVTVYFTKTHIADLKAVISVDHKERIAPDEA